MSAIIALVITALGLFAYICDMGDIAHQQRLKREERDKKRGRRNR